MRSPLFAFTIPIRFGVLALTTALILTIAGSNGRITLAADARIAGYIEGASLPDTQPRVLWKHRSSEREDFRGRVTMDGVSDAVVVDGCVYFGDDRGILTALSAVDGSVLWEHQAPQLGSSFPRIAQRPAVDEDFVYYTFPFGLAAVRREDGMRAWNRPLGKEHVLQINPQTGQRWVARPETVGCRRHKMMRIQPTLYSLIS
ncbi:MAG: PQQ-binding-like beta-propeller repeat protein [Planctomycetaceae bacterium]